MKDTLTKLFVTLAAIVLGLPFIAIALLGGARALAGAESMQDELLLGALALGGAAASVVKNVGRPTEGMSEATALHITSIHRNEPQGALLSVHSHN